MLSSASNWEIKFSPTGGIGVTGCWVTIFLIATGPGCCCWGCGWGWGCVVIGGGNFVIGAGGGVVIGSGSGVKSGSGVGNFVIGVGVGAGSGIGVGGGGVVPTCDVGGGVLESLANSIKPLKPPEAIA